MSFDNIYLKILTNEEKVEEDESKIRASSMPFCPIKFIITSNEKYIKGSTWNYFGDFYCDIGTAIHSAVQKWIPKSYPGVLFGNWICKKCYYYIDNKKVNYRYNFKAGPLLCPSCKREMLYDEIAMYFLLTNNIVTGHCDGILIEESSIIEALKDKWDFKKNPLKSIINIDDKVLIARMVNDIIYNSDLTLDAFVFELKSKGVFIVNKGIIEPELKHRCQAISYTGALRDFLPYCNIKNLNIKGYIIKYISRDNPRARSIDFKKVQTSDVFYKNTCSLVNKMLIYLNKNKYKKLLSLKACKKWPSIFPECEYQEVCDSLSSKKLKSIIKDDKNLNKFLFYQKGRIF